MKSCGTVLSVNKLTLMHEWELFGREMQTRSERAAVVHSAPGLLITWSGIKYSPKRAAMANAGCTTHTHGQIKTASRTC